MTLQNWEPIEKLLSTPQKAVQKIKSDIETLWREAEQMKGNDIERNAEISNIQSIIYAGLYVFVHKSIMEGEDTIEVAAKKLQFLKENPDSAGNHDKQRLPIIQWTNLMNSIALQGNKTRLSDFILNAEVRAAKKRLMAAVGKADADRIQDEWYIENSALFNYSK
jgi:hypothetical protein